MTVFVDSPDSSSRPGLALLENEDRSALGQCRWLRRYHRRGTRRGLGYRFTKRAIDIVAVVVASPLLVVFGLLSALALKIEDPKAPVMFAQERTGYRGKRFRLRKFRTMVPNAEELKAQLAHLNQRQWPDFKIDRDPRITRVGRVLRKLSLDEIPQFLNVLKGDMTLVGPRPTSLPPEKYEHWQTERFEVHPGITGLWQVGGRESTSFVERSRLDISYVERRSIRMDLEIMLRTVPTVILGRGSY